MIRIVQNDFPQRFTKKSYASSAGPFSILHKLNDNVVEDLPKSLASVHEDRVSDSLHVS